MPNAALATQQIEACAGSIRLAHGGFFCYDIKTEKYQQCNGLDIQTLIGTSYL
jgi:hypothetical protein